MCGIFSTININIPLEKVIPFLLHRGPDAQTTWCDGNVQLHHFRLSILDHEGGVQPMHRGDFVVIFNGELYNHQDVRQKYQLLCNTNSDTETLLAAFEKIGWSCLDDFDGMFAFCLYHKVTKRMYVARDRAGKKPLYIFKSDKQIVVSSELKALSKTIALTPNLENIDLFFKGSFTGDNTAYKNVLELAAGHLAEIDVEKGSLHIKKWWSIEDQYQKQSDDDYITAEEKIKSFIHAGVKRRIDSSDLEVGAFLSGGIDSGLVVGAASYYTSNLKTFTVSMPGAYDEAPLAALVAKKYHTQHTEIHINFDNLRNDLERIVLNYGEPFFDSSAIPSYYVSKEAKNHLTVILNGDGADELFAGYRRYVPAAKKDFYSSSNSQLWSYLLKILPEAHEKKSKYNYLFRLVKVMAADVSNRYWLLTSDVFQNTPDAYINSQIKNNQFISDILKRNPNLSSLQKQMCLDFQILLSGILLKKMDIATMAHSLEGRSPLLSKELLEYVPGISDKYKIKGTQTKYILRNIAKQWLPSGIFSQPKRGFEIPLKKWINNELNEMVFDYLSPKVIFSHQFIKPKFIEDLLLNKVKVSDEIRAKMLYQLLVNEIWAKDNGFN